MIDGVYHDQRTADDPVLDRAFRPRTFDEFVGQRRVVENLSIYIAAARSRQEPMDHVLLCGLPGLGKTTLAALVAREMGADFKATSGPVIEKAGDLAGILTNLKRGDVLFIDEIHRLSPSVEEYLYSAMEDFRIDIVIDQGPSARSVKIELQPFTLVGATTREGLLTPPFRARFGVLERIEPYPPEDLEIVVGRSARILGVAIADEACRLLALRSRGTPRIANRLVRRARDLAQVRGREAIDLATANEVLDMLGIDRYGLETLDRRILSALADQGGGPLGLKTIAVVVGEEERTVEDVYEPYLIREGFVLKTPRGRQLTEKAYRLLSLKPAATGLGRGLFDAAT